MRSPTLEDAINLLQKLTGMSHGITGTVIDTLPLGDRTAYVVKDSKGQITGLVPLMDKEFPGAETGKEISTMPIMAIGIGKPKGTNLPHGVKFYFGVPSVSSYGSNQ